MDGGPAIPRVEAPKPSTAKHGWKGILAFLTVYLVWGSTFLAIRYAVATIPPLFVAATRHLIAGSILLAWALGRGERPTWQGVQAGLVLGALFFLISHGTLHWAEQFVPSGVAALVIATQPVFVALMLPWFRLGAPPSGKTYAGLALGIGSVLALFRPDVATSRLANVGLVAVLISSIAWSAGIVLSRKVQPKTAGTMNAALPLLCGSLMLLVAGVVCGEHRQLHLAAVTTKSFLGLLYLVVFGSLLAFVAYTWLLRHYPPTLVATHTYVNPLVAVALGWLVAGEPMSISVILSAGLAISAIGLVNSGSRDGANPVAEVGGNIGRQDVP
jgi:drug/metabolite transporter (DMT)-like permease